MQIIKVSTKNGKSQDKVFNVLWSGDRKTDPKTGKLPVIGNSVYVKTATFANTIGAPELIGQWTDRNLIPRPALPTMPVSWRSPRRVGQRNWTSKLNLLLNPKVPSAIQQRAWSHRLRSMSQATSMKMARCRGSVWTRSSRWLVCSIRWVNPSCPCEDVPRMLE